jgi:hypothetical protein
VCTVTDDDGGVGEDWLIVRVVDVQNGNFEGGFHTHASGAVANEWEPYGSAPLASGFAGGSPFVAEEMVVHDGQRSQHVRGSGTSVFGLHQSIGANVGWDYQVSFWYHVGSSGAGTVRLGIDPTGGIDPAAPATVWASALTSPRGVSWRACQATARAITVFLEYQNDGGTSGAWFDSVELLAYPCPRATRLPATLRNRNGTASTGAPNSAPGSSVRHSSRTDSRLRR